jgi:hypothetical protein
MPTKKVADKQQEPSTKTAAKVVEPKSNYHSFMTDAMGVKKKQGKKGSKK